MSVKGIYKAKNVFFICNVALKQYFNYVLYSQFFRKISKPRFEFFVFFGSFFAFFQTKVWVFDHFFWLLIHPINIFTKFSTNVVQNAKKSHFYHPTETLKMALPYRICIFVDYMFKFYNLWLYLMFYI